MPAIWISVAWVCLAAAPGEAADVPDLQKIDRQIKKEPAYTAEQPLYGLLLVGQARTPVWMVLDKWTLTTGRYDVLYIDLNANGDLTEPGERFLGPVFGDSVRFNLPDFQDPASDSRHTAFHVTVSSGSSPTVMVGLKWRSGFAMGGGYPEDPDKGGYMKFGDKPATAPVLWANGDGPFRFQRWYVDKLAIGAADARNDLKLFVGQQGVGASSFWAFQEHFLPEAEALQATLICQDGQGKELRLVCQLKERC